MLEVVQETLSAAEKKMHRAVEVTQEDFAGIRTGRATPALVEKLLVEYYGSETPLQQLAQINVPEPRVLTVAPYDKSTIPAIEKAILASNIGITPSNDGSVIHLGVPALTEERRKEMVKNAHSRAEEGRVAIRNVRRHTRDELDDWKKEGELSEDDLKRAEKELQDLTDRYVKEIDEMLGRKEAELLEV